MTTGRDDTTLRLRVVPRASRDEIVGWREPGVLSVRVTAPPVEGEANRAVGALLARALGVRPSAWPSCAARAAATSWRESKGSPPPRCS